MLDSLTRLALETIQMNKQALIFAPSRASAEKAAEEIAGLTKLNYPEFEKEVLKAASTPTKQCRRLSHCIKKGIAFHHAGLLPEQREFIENEFRKGTMKIICCTPTLCLSGDTLIWQPEGNTPVKNFRNSYLFALSQSRLRVMKAQTVNKIKNSQKLLEIISVSGHSIKLTPHHKILVKRDGNKMLIPATECKPKDKIATAGKLNFYQTVKPKLSYFVKDNHLPIWAREFTKEDFYFIGSMLGDGHSGAETRDKKIFYKGSPTFTSGDLSSIETIENIAQSFDPFRKRVKRRGSISLILSKKKWFREFLCRCGVELGKNKYINSSLGQADLNLVKYLIQGLFDTDGYVQKGRNIGFSNISPQLIKNLQKALLRFGIVTKVRKRPGRRIHIITKFYHIKDHYELSITQQRSILLFQKWIGFGLKRKQEALDKLVASISQVLFFECKRCSYKIYTDLFSGRTKEQKEWGLKKKQVIELLGRKGELGSREIERELKFQPRHSKGNRLNHHYELISKRRKGSQSITEWYWSLKPIGSWIYKKIIGHNKELGEFFSLDACPLCNEKLNKSLRKKWRDSDCEGDIFWDFVRSVKEVESEKDVYDVILPDKPSNDHLFVANGFIVHNSAGMSLPAFRVIIKSLKRYSGQWGADWIPVLEYLQMAGRAGRPEYEKEGQAISLAKDEAEKEEIYQTYVCGKPEEIYSKLAVEPVLRTHVLSLIASGIIRDETALHDFFAKTFWAQQFEDQEKLNSILNKMKGLLEEWRFITTSRPEKQEFRTASQLKSTDISLRATPLGKRVSELYLDPLTAKHLLDGLERYQQQPHPETFPLLQMICHTLEMRPLLRIKAKEQDRIQEQLVKNYDLLLEQELSAFDLEYEEFMNSIKTTLFFEAWITEKDEDYLMETFDIRPGEIRVKLEIADWLLYGCEELAGLLLQHETVKALRRIRMRVKYGAREDLLPLLKLKGIGRVRARKLVLQGIKDIGDVKRADLTTLGQILGKIVAEDVKKQVGEEIEEIPEGRRKGQLSMMKF